MTVPESAASKAGQEAGLVAPSLSPEQVERLRSLFGTALAALLKERAGGRRAA